MRNNVFRLLAMVALLLTFGGAWAQNVGNGSRWWDGEKLYTAEVDEAGNVTMNGESEEMGGDRFRLIKVSGKAGHYTLASGNSQGWLFIRGKVGWEVELVRQEGVSFLAVRQPNGNCVYTLRETPDNLKNCVAQQKIIDERDVSWMLQNHLLDTHYLGRFSKPQLRLMRNEILARHGWTFQAKDLRQHFGRQPWYKPVADNNSITLGIVELTNLQLLKSEEAADDDRVRYENTKAAPKMAEAVGGVITVTTEEQFINALGNDREVQLGRDVHLNLSRILEQEDKFSGVPGRAWATIAKRDGGDQPVIISEFCNDGQQLTLKNFRRLVISGQHNSSIEVDPRYSYCLSFMDCEGCRVQNLTIGHTEGGYCDGGVIGVEGGSRNFIFDCDLYGCGTYGIVARETNGLTVARTNIHHCTYGIMELWSSLGVKFSECDFFENREFALITNNGSEYTVFEKCRFYNNWPEAPLFSTNEDITLYGCEIYHPEVGARESLREPDGDCKWSEKANYVPEPRVKPIGPDVK